jgi:hypothetical protein
MLTLTKRQLENIINEEIARCFPAFENALLGYLDNNEETVASFCDFMGTEPIDRPIPKNEIEALVSACEEFDIDPEDPGHEIIDAFNRLPRMQRDLKKKEEEEEEEQPWK